MIREVSSTAPSGSLLCVGQTEKVGFSLVMHIPCFSQTDLFLRSPFRADFTFVLTTMLHLMVTPSRYPVSMELDRCTGADEAKENVRPGD